MGFLVNTKHTHKHTVISNKTVPKLCTILTKCFFPYVNPTSYLKSNKFDNAYSKIWCFFVWSNFSKIRHVLIHQINFIKKTIKILNHHM